MTHKHSLTVTLLLTLSACGSQTAPNGSSQIEQTPSSIELPATVPTPAQTITVDQDANATVAPGPVQPSSPVIATPLPTASPAPVATATPAPTPTPTATPSCTQTRADGTYDYTCGLWILNPLNSGMCQAHAAELELINQNGTWYNGTYSVTIDAQGDLAWNGLTLSINGSGVYEVHSTQAGRTSELIPCYFNALPAN